MFWKIIPGRWTNIRKGSSITTLPCETCAAETFDFQRVTNGVCGRVQVRENEADIRRSWVKINGAFCHYVLLTEQLMPGLRDISGEFFIFQRDSASAHRACDLRDNQRSGMGDTSFHFTRPVAPKDSDLNPVDYRMWKEMQQ